MLHLIFILATVTIGIECEKAEPLSDIRLLVFRMAWPTKLEVGDF